MSPRAASQQRGHAAYPPVVEVAPDVAPGTNLSSETEFAGAFSFVVSPQCEKVTVPWIAEEPPECLGLVTSSIGSGVPVDAT